MLLFASLLCFISYGVVGQSTNIICGCVLFGVVVLGATLAYVQEAKAGDVMKRFKDMLPPKCLVVREGLVREVEALSLVIGDLVKLETGAKIPADLRLYWNNGLKVE